MLGQLWTLLKPSIVEHLRWIVTGWVYLVVGAMLAAWVLWDAHQRGSRHTKIWAWACQFFPPMILLYLLFRHSENPIVTPFGQARYVSPSGELLPPNARPALKADEDRPPPLGLILLLTTLFPGLGQVALGQWARAVGLWILIAFSGAFVAFYLLGVQKSWTLDPTLLPNGSPGKTVTVGFRIPPYLFWLMLGELAIIYLWAYADAISTADERIHALPHRKEPPLAFYLLRVTRPNQPEKTMRVQKENLFVGSDPDCDIEIDGADVPPKQLSLYLSHEHDESHHLFSDEHQDAICLRDLRENGGVSLNGKSVQEASLKPGDVVRIGDAELHFDALP